MSDVWKVGITIVLGGNHARELSSIASRLLGIHTTVNQINANIGRWRTGLIGAAGILGGREILGGLGKIANHGEKLLDQQDKLIRAGRTHAEVAQLTADAFERITKAVPTAKASDVLRVANELTLVKGDFKDAIAAASGALKLEAILGNATGRKSEGEGYNVWRALELKNVTMDHALTDKLMGGIVQAMIVSGGKITGLDWLTTARQGGVSWTNAGTDFVLGTLPTVIQELGGMRTGTSMMTAYQTLLGATTLKKQQVDMFAKLGLLDMSKVTKDHGHWSVAAGGIKGSALGMSDPFRWTQEVLRPALERIGLTTIDKQREVMAKLFPNRNANRMFDIFLDPNSVQRILKDRDLYGKGMGLDTAYDRFIKENPKGVKEAFHAQFESMMEAIGAPLMKAALPVMIGVTNMFNNIGEFASKHPTAIKIIGEGIAALGLALMVGGGVAIFAALGPIAAITAGIAALGAALIILDQHIPNLKSMAYGALKFTPGPIGDALRLFDAGKKLLPAIPSAEKHSSLGGGDVYLDGEKVGRILDKRTSLSLSAVPRGSAYFDHSMTDTPVDFTFARG